jgi:hypothetical protein
VKRRNKIAHPTRLHFFDDCAAIDNEIADVMKEIRDNEHIWSPLSRNSEGGGRTSATLATLLHARK